MLDVREAMSSCGGCLTAPSRQAAFLKLVVSLIFLYTTKPDASQCRNEGWEEKERQRRYRVGSARHRE